MKTTILKYALSGVLAVGLASCGNEWLDEYPSTAVEAEKAINTISDLDAAANGMYQIVKGTGDFTGWYAAGFLCYGDVRGEDLQASYQASRYNTEYTQEWTSAQDAPSLWSTTYIAIRRANRVIEAVDTKFPEEADAQHYKAEALVIRALAHFDMVRVYGKTYTEDNGASLGIPVVTTILNPEDKGTRSTVAKVYEQVIKDLTDAINSGTLSTDITPGFVDVWGAKAILARVYLTQGDNQKAFKTAEDIILHSPHKLWTNAEYVNAFISSNSMDTYSKEVMFSLGKTSTEDFNDREDISYIYDESGYGEIVATEAFVNLLKQDPNDVRLGLFHAPTIPANEQYYGKNPVYLNKYGSMSQYNSVSVIRLSEVYLTAAEAAAKRNDAPNAQRYLNAIVLRANPNYNNGQGVSQADATLSRILLERRKELVGEGQRFFDAMRNNETITRYTSESDRGWHKALTSESRSYNRSWHKALLPIPQGELDVNPEIRTQQNPGY